MSLKELGAFVDGELRKATVKWRDKEGSEVQFEALLKEPSAAKIRRVMRDAKELVDEVDIDTVTISAYLVNEDGSQLLDYETAESLTAEASTSLVQAINKAFEVRDPKAKSRQKRSSGVKSQLD